MAPKQISMPSSGSNLVVAGNVANSELSYKEERLVIEKLHRQLEEALILYSGKIFHTQAELTNILGQVTVYRQMLIDLLTGLGIKITMTAYDPGGKRQEMLHIFGTTRTVSTELLRQGIAHAMTKWNESELKLSRLLSEVDKLMASLNVKESTLKTADEQKTALLAEVSALKKETAHLKRQLDEATNTSSNQLLVKNSKPYLLVNTKSKGFFIGTENPVDTTPDLGKQVASIKVASLIKTSDINKALRFESDEHAYKFLEHIKKMKSKINENKGIRPQYLGNYTVGTQLIIY